MLVVKPCLAFTFTVTVAIALHRPYNVTMEAVNTRYILKWDWNQTLANYTMKFTADYTYSNRKSIKESYRKVCYRTAGRFCDFSFRNLSYSSSYVLRVRAEGRRESSPWSVLPFCPDEQASLGPPTGVEVQSGESTLTVFITGPLTVYNTSMSSILPLSYRVQYWEKHAPQRSGSQEQKGTGGTLSALQPGTEYCLRVSAFNLDYEMTSPYTRQQCVQTRGRGHHLGWHTLVMVLCCVMLASCTMVMCRKKIKSLCLFPTLPSSIQDTSPVLTTRLLEPWEESCAALEVVAAQTLQQRPLEAEWPEQTPQQRPLEAEWLEQTPQQRPLEAEWLEQTLQQRPLEDEWLEQTLQQRPLEAVWLEQTLQQRPLEDERWDGSEQDSGRGSSGGSGVVRVTVDSQGHGGKVQGLVLLSQSASVPLAMEMAVAGDMG